MRYLKTVLEMISIGILGLGVILLFDIVLPCVFIFMFLYLYGILM